MRLLPLFICLVTEIAPAPPDVAHMGVKDLLTEGTHALNNLTHSGNLQNNPDLIRLQGVFAALSGSLHDITQDASIGFLERGVDGLIHEAFHPIDFVEDQLHGAVWDAENITDTRSSFNLLRGIVVLFCCYVLIGSIIMAKYYNAVGMERMPHLSFWMAYPGLVNDGVAFAIDMIGSGNREIGFDRISAVPSSKFSGSRETFAQFEPI